MVRMWSCHCPLVLSSAAAGSAGSSYAPSRLEASVAFAWISWCACLEIRKTHVRHGAPSVAAAETAAGSGAGSMCAVPQRVSSLGSDVLCGDGTSPPLCPR